MKFLLLINFLFFAVCFSQKKEFDLDQVSSKDYSIRFDSNYFSRMDGSDQSVILFIKNPNEDYLELLKISVEDVSKHKNMDLQYFSELREYALKDQYKILSKTKGELNGSQYIDFIYEKTTVRGNNKYDFKNLERLYFHQFKIYKIFFNSSKSDYEKHFPRIEQILKSFQMK